MPLHLSVSKISCLTFLPVHHLLLGMRYDYHSVHKNIFTTRVAWKWSLNDKQTIRVNAGTGFRVVSLFTEEHAALTGSRVVEVKEELKVGLGIEYYGSLGEFRDILPTKMQEHLLGPIIDLYIHPMWEIQTGFLFGLTENSNQQIFKLLLGRRIGKQ